MYLKASGTLLGVWNACLIINKSNYHANGLRLKRELYCIHGRHLQVLPWGEN